jgi:hypothetical protein
MQNSFRPVALRLPLSDVAALADATARAIAPRRRRDQTPAFAFRLRLRLAPASTHPGWTMASAIPALATDHERRQ